jgi:hypothetical protein
VAVFQTADEGAVDVRVKRKLLLREAGFLTGFSEDIAKHAGQFSGLAA